MKHNLTESYSNKKPPKYYFRRFYDFLILNEIIILFKIKNAQNHYL